MSEKKIQIQNSTTNDIVLIKQKSKNTIEVRIPYDNGWLSRDTISRLVDIEMSVVTKHLKKIFADNELQDNSVDCLNSGLRASPPALQVLAGKDACIPNIF